MESKDSLLPLESYYGFHTRERDQEDLDDYTRKLSAGEDVPLIVESSSSSPSASMSPRTPADNTALPNAADDPPESPIVEGDVKEPASGPQRTRSTSSASASGSKPGESREKRKRSRVTPEQLTHLERFFASDRSPTAARRREISDLLGMQERQTQIWFQNRRAKAKLLDGKKSRHSGGDWSVTPPDTPPQLSAGFEADLHSLIHEDQPVSIIPCTDLSIGSWRRIATGKHDLVAYVCEAKRCLTWFIHSAGYGFKMEIPFDTITHTEFRNASPGEGLATFTLSQTPVFFLENIASPRSGGGLGGAVKTWKKCSDWTEGTQASQVLRHDLIGSAVQLAHVLSDLREYRTRSNIPLVHPDAYNVNASDLDTSVSPTAVQIPQPPLATLQSDAFPSLLQRPAFFGHSRKRSSSGPPALAHHVPSAYGEHEYPPITDRAPAPPYSASYASTSFERPAPMPGYSYGQRAVSHYMAGDPHPSLHVQQQVHEPPVSDYSSVPISHGASHRNYTSNPVSHYYAPDRASPPTYLNPSLQHPAPSLTHPQFGTPSPPLMSSPYGGGMLDSNGSSAQAPPEIGGHPRSLSADTGMAGHQSVGIASLSYYGQDEHRNHGARTSPAHFDSGSLTGALGGPSSSASSDFSSSHSMK